MRYVDQTAVGDSLSWQGVVAALEAGHHLPKAEISDQFLTRDPDTLLSRAAWIDGLGFGVKSVSVMPGNAAIGMPSVHGAMLVFDDKNGTLEAVVDSGLLTAWKTAGDSVFGAKLLARSEAKRHVIVGAGVVAETLVRAYAAMFPELTEIAIWNRTPRRAIELAEKMAKQGFPTSAVTDLPQACADADIISTATMSCDPVLHGAWIQPGTHVDLIGAFKSDMREADDALLQKGRLFVDSRDTTIEHIGELMIPIKAGAISAADIKGDYYDLMRGEEGRLALDDITILKNGGGAHLDLMTAKYILSACT